MTSQHVPVAAQAQSPDRRGFFGLVLAHENLAFLLVALVWLLALYGRLLAAPFIAGDVDQIVDNPALASWSELWSTLLRGPIRLSQELHGSVGVLHYRPLYWLSLAVDRHLWALNPAGFHGTNLLLFLMAGFLGFRLLRALNVSAGVSAGTAFVWFSLPVNSEVVAWVTARGYSLCAVFLFLALLAAVHSLISRGKSLWLAIYFLASLAALLSHPAGLLVLPLTFLVVAAARRASVRQRSLLFALGLFADAVWFAGRSYAGMHQPTQTVTAWGAGLSFFEYLRWLVLPMGLSVDRTTSVPALGASSAAILAWLFLLVIAASALFLRRSRPAAAAGLAWLGVGLLPFCGLLAIDQGMAERFVYIASAGFALLVVALVTGSGTTLRKPLVALLALWVLWGAWRVHGRAEDWTDEARLYTASLQATPNSSALYLNLGQIAREKEDYPAAEHNLREASRLRPLHVETMVALGELLEKIGDDDGAEKEIRHAMTLEPTRSKTYTAMGMLDYELGRISEAEGMFGAAIRYDKNDPEPYTHMAQLYQEGGAPDAALVMYQRVLKLKPNDQATKDNIKALKASMKAAAEASQ